MPLMMPIDYASCRFHFDADADDADAGMPCRLLRFR